MKKILLVDDDEDFAETLNFYLTQKGYLVNTANSSKEAFNKLKSEIPDVILLDIMLPDINGIEMCKELKADSDLSSIPVIMVTAKRKRKYIEDSMKTGADGYIPKPFNLPRLIERIEELTSNPQQKPKQEIK
ncbi:response regulator transcription factor [candidate division WOR-3 bacterium]|nr:response regulator transcription factor [candidate division WOR-3 bacterium]